MASFDELFPGLHSSDKRDIYDRLATVEARLDQQRENFKRVNALLKELIRRTETLEDKEPTQ